MRSQTTSLLGLLLGAAFAIPGYSQIITSVAGNSTWGAVSHASLDAAGNLYAADYDKNVVYKIDRFGASVIVAGSGGSGGYQGDGGPATSAKINRPLDVAVSSDGTLYISDSNNYRIRKVAPNGIITTFAGNGAYGFEGDGGPALAARLSFPGNMLLDPKGVLYFVDTLNYRIRKIGTDGLISTVAGSGNATYTGDGGLATAAEMAPGALALGSDGSIYFTDDGAPMSFSGGNARVRKISPNGTISTVAGKGTNGSSGDGGAATAAQLSRAAGVALDSDGNLYIAEWSGYRIRKVAPNGIITTYAGTGQQGSSGDGGPAAMALLNGPTGLTTDPQGNLYVADTGNPKIRKIAPALPPSISSTDAVVPVFLGKSSFGSNMYVTIYGSNLATTTKAWDTSFNGINAPTSIDGVSVTVNNRPAFIVFVSPGQININTPEDTATGTVNIVVKNSVGISNAGTATRARLSPTLQSVPEFSASGKSYVVAQTPDFRSFIGPPGLIKNASFTPARAGDTVIIYAIGCGPTNPSTQAGVIPAQTSPLALPFQVKIGGVEAKVPFAGMLAGTIGLYQLNVVIPTVPVGDQSIELIVDSVSNAQNLLITVGP